MIPYLLLSTQEKSRVQKVLEEHALDEATLDAAISLLEEIGDDSTTIRKALASEERTGVMREGTFRDLLSLWPLRAYDPKAWKKIPRRGRRL
jgi:hypothetical protein